MIPLRDVDARARGIPMASAGLIAANVLVFLLMSAGSDARFERITWKLAIIPKSMTSKEPVTWEVVTLGSDTGSGPTLDVELVPPPRTPFDRLARLKLGARSLYDAGLRRVVILDQKRVGQGVPGWLSLLSSMFMHGGLMHLLGNMLFLMVFGGRLEFRMGRVRYLFFYLASGLLAGLTHVLLNSSSDLPCVGASGAISGLLGGYILLFPQGRILTLLPIFIFIQLIELPAFIFIGIWAVMQVMLVRGPGSVAVWAHLGGFVFGLLLVHLFAPRRDPARGFSVRPMRGRPDPFEHFR